MTIITAPPDTELTPGQIEQHNRAIVERYVPEIDKRGGETGIAQKRGSDPLRVLDEGTDRHSGRPLYLLGVDGWRYYSCRAGSWRASLRYLVGEDDNGPFAVRLPSSANTISDALHALTPAAVHKAMTRGNVRRQGNVYAIPTTARYDTTESGWVDTDEEHWWNAETRYLTHRPSRTGERKHRPLKLTAPVRFVEQSVYGMGRGWGRGAGD